MFIHSLIRVLDRVTQAFYHKALSELQIWECINQIQARLLCHFSTLPLKSYRNALSSCTAEKHSIETKKAKTPESPAPAKWVRFYLPHQAFESSVPFKLFSMFNNSMENIFASFSGFVLIISAHSKGKPIGQRQRDCILYGLNKGSWEIGEKK